MGNSFKILALFVACLVLVGCASRKPAVQPVDPTVAEYQNFRRNYDVVATPDLDEELAFDNGTLPRSDKGATSVVLQRAHKAIGTPYVYGGTKPGGFDCSGLVQWAYKGAGIKLPRTAREQSQAGYHIKDKSQMRAGDIVAFRRSRGGYHTGIYLGDGKFIHAPRTNTRVRISSMETGYFARNFIGARRVDTSEPNVALVEATRKQDMQLEARSQASKKAPLAAKKTSKSASRAKATVHTVKSGDTLSGLAARHGVSVKQIVAANKLKDAHSLRIGQKLTIPAKSTAQASKSTSKQTAQKAKRSAKASTKTAAKASSKTSAKSTAQASNAKSAKPSGKQIQLRPAKRSVDEARASGKG